MTSAEIGISPTPNPRPRVAVVGSGVAGLVAAYRLSAQAEVTLFEADSRFGGHAHTHRIPLDDGTVLAVDSGFIVHNDRTYPTLTGLFTELGIETQESDMSMSVRSLRTGLEYAGARGLRGLFPRAANLGNRRYLRMLGEVLGFHRAARALLATEAGEHNPTLADFLVEHRFSDFFTENFMVPLVAAVWSCDDHTARHYPARHLFEFLLHHGMLSVSGSPRWRTVTGGSATYVDAIITHLRAHGSAAHCGRRVHQITPTEYEVTLEFAENDSSPTEAAAFDGVVIATHPHQALGMLTDPTPAQRRILGAIPYLSKPAVLHSDTSLLPLSRGARASWNQQILPDDRAVAVTYDLSRLMRLPRSAPPMLVTLGRVDVVDRATIHAEMTYEHPVYTPTSVAAQAQLAEVECDRISFAGAYHGWGFHEDGASSGSASAAALIGRLHTHERARAQRP